MMKKIFVFLLILLAPVLLFTKNDTTNYQYINKKIGIACKLSDDWNIFTKSAKAPEYFKEFLKTKKSEHDSPLFMGVNKNQTAFVSCLIEPYQGNLESYIELLNIVFKQSNISINKSIYAEDKNRVFITYNSEANNIPITFYEAITVQNETAFRLTFWTMSSIIKTYHKDFLSYIENTLFEVEYDNKKRWEALWSGVFPVESIMPGNIEAKEETKNNYKYMFFPVKGKTNTVYIMGSIHIGRDSFYPFPDNIEKAFEKSKYYVVEVNVTNPENITKEQDIKSYGLLEDNKTLDQVLSKELYAIVKNQFAKYSVPMEKMERYKPWVIASTLLLLKTMSLGYSSDSGIEQYFLKKANKKTILELESFEEQMNIFNSIDGNSYLGMTIITLESIEEELSELIDSWKNQDIKKMEEILFDYSITSFPTAEIDDFNNKLYFNRNINMVKKIKDYLSQKDDYFVVVGSGHLVGKQGVLELLKQEGYIIE